MSDSFKTLWTTAHQAPLSMGFPRQEYWSGLPFPSPTQESNLSPPALQVDSLMLSHKRSPSPLHKNLQIANFQKCKRVRVSRQVKLVHRSGAHCHICASRTNGCAFVYFTVQYYIEYSSTASLFQAQDVQKQLQKK